MTTTHKTTPLLDLVTFLFSKNAGPYMVTFDILFKDKESYEIAKKSAIFSRETFAGLYGVDPESITSVYEFDAINLIKFTMKRRISSGDYGDRSVFGSQMWAPLMGIEVPLNNGPDCG